VSVEPFPDNSEAPFMFKPLVLSIPSDAHIRFNKSGVFVPLRYREQIRTLSEVGLMSETGDQMIACFWFCSYL